MTKQEFLDILEKNSNLIENYKFTEFYKKLKYDQKVYFTDLFLDCGINPLKYMKEVPDSFVLNSFYVTYKSKIENIVIPNNITYIGDHAFCECSSLTSVTFEENSQLKSIGKLAFQWCDNLTSIEIPNSVKNIEYGAFYGCLNLTKVTIPSSVTSIGESAFYKCKQLKNIYYEGSEEDWQKINIEKGNKRYLHKAEIHYNSKI